MRLHIKLLLISVLLSSCITEVDIDLSDVTSNLVVNGLMEAGDTIKVHISQTQPANDTVFQIKDDAQVQLSCGDNLTTLTRIDDFNYQSNWIAQPGSTYAVAVSCDGYENTNASDSIPVSCTKFEISEYKPYAYVDGEGYNYSSITIELLNIPHYKCYYELRFKSYDEFYSQGYYYPLITSNDIIARNEGIVNEVYDRAGMLFTNELIKDDNRKLTFFFINSPDDELNKVTAADVILIQCTSDYFTYRKQLYLNFAGQEYDIWGGAPVDAYSNTNNGYGIFAGSNSFIVSKEF